MTQLMKVNDINYCEHFHEGTIFYPVNHTLPHRRKYASFLDKTLVVVTGKSINLTCVFFDLVVMLPCSSMSRLGSFLMVIWRDNRLHIQLLTKRCVDFLERLICKETLLGFFYM